MLLEHGRYYSSGMDALVTACSWMTNANVFWALKTFKTFAVIMTMLAYIDLKQPILARTGSAFCASFGAKSL